MVDNSSIEKSFYGILRGKTDSVYNSKMEKAGGADDQLPDFEVSDAKKRIGNRSAVINYYNRNGKDSRSQFGPIDKNPSPDSNWKKYGVPAPGKFSEWTMGRNDEFQPTWRRKQWVRRDKHDAKFESDQEDKYGGGDKPMVTPESTKYKRDNKIRNKKRATDADYIQDEYDPYDRIDEEEVSIGDEEEMSKSIRDMIATRRGDYIEKAGGATAELGFGPEAARGSTHMERDTPVHDLSGTEYGKTKRRLNTDGSEDVIGARTAYIDDDLKDSPVDPDTIIIGDMTPSAESAKLHPAHNKARTISIDD